MRMPCLEICFVVHFYLRNLSQLHKKKLQLSQVKHNHEGVKEHNAQLLFRPFVATSLAKLITLSSSDISYLYIVSIRKQMHQL